MGRARNEGVVSFVVILRDSVPVWLIGIARRLVGEIAADLAVRELGGSVLQPIDSAPVEPRVTVELILVGQLVIAV